MRSGIPKFVAAVVLLASCGGPGPLSEDATFGPEPQLSAPRETLIPTIRTPEAVGWPEGAAPVAPEGLVVRRFAEGLDHPRWLYVLPNGDVLVAESSTEAEQGGGVEGWIRNAVQRHAGALNVSADRITLLRDADGDGVVEQRAAFLENLNQPFGMALIGSSFYVANTDGVLRFPYEEGQTRIAAEGELILPLPYRAEGNGHWTRNLIASVDGSKLYVTVGSVSNVGDDGMEVEQGRAAIHEFNPDGSGSRIFASGLRNPNGLAWEPVTGRLWTTVNERDMLGDDLVPDYMTGVDDGDFFGWPYFYWGDRPDPRFAAEDSPNDLNPRAPDYALGAHTASLGLAFYTAQALGEGYSGGAFIGQHGSWNRSKPSGYQVLFVRFNEGGPVGMPEVFLTGFLNDAGEAMGRPVGVAVDRAGALLVADDAGDIVWRVARR